MVGNRGLRHLKRLASGLVGLFILSGCLYPKDQTPGYDRSAHGAVRTVQAAVDEYKRSTGLLPIVNADASVPIYEKFKVDFAKLKRMGYLDSIPSAAFEGGGSYQFLIVDEETNPLVKLLDIGVYQGLSDLQKRVDEYRSGHRGANPTGEAAAGSDFRYVDFGKLGVSRPKLSSMYSHRPLEMMVDDEGNVYADYGSDIAEAVKKTESPPRTDEDLRHRLVEASDFVPVKSPVYRWKDGGPVPVK